MLKLSDNQPVMNNQSIECLGVILAGGLSSRMGKDKSQLTRQQPLSASGPSAALQSSMSMLDFSQQLLLDAGIKNIVISGDNHQVPDLVPQSGPVGGIYSVLANYPEHLQPKSLLILPVDLPLMTADALARLRLKGELSQKATYFKDSQGQAHHIPLYLPNNAFLKLFLSQVFQGTALLNEGSKSVKNGPSVKALLKQMPNQAIDSINKNNLFNTNTPQEWQQAKQLF